MHNHPEGKITIIVGAGQVPGEMIGNGCASAILYAREGTKVMIVDYRFNSAEDTCEMITNTVAKQLLANNQ